ncbi:hypothetical protein [Streptomyces sp. NPDC004629]|uniref:hypothetical protein n=1 Tax=Streptomyces sp. NPDC004629 TaxID=3364705 RepID=UPI0036BFC58F
MARTCGTVCGGRATGTHCVRDYTRPQVARIVAAYKPRKTDHDAATACLARTVTAAQAAQHLRGSYRPRRSRSSKVRILRATYQTVTDLEAALT